jgi:hypothetical protein
MSHENLEQVLKSAGSPVAAAAQFADRSLRISGRPPRVHQLARRAARLARNLRAVRSVAPHDRSVRERARRAEGALGSRRQQLQDFKVDQAKQIVVCNPRGYVIGDAILFYLADQSFNIVGRPPVANWVQYHVETGKYNATVERDERSAQNQGRRKAFRFQIQGPNAINVMEAATGGAVPDIKFFHMGVFPIAGLKVRALRHGMVGQPGWEIFGPWEQGDQVREALLQAARRSASARSGARTYPTSTIESGWIPSPLPPSTPATT